MLTAVNKTPHLAFARAERKLGLRWNTTCFDDGLGGFNSHLAKPANPEASAIARNDDANKLANDLNGLQLSDLIGN